MEFPRAEIKEDMKGISVIVSAVEEGLPTIISVTDVSTGTQNGKLTPGGGLVGTGNYNGGQYFAISSVQNDDLTGKNKRR